MRKIKRQGPIYLLLRHQNELTLSGMDFAEFIRYLPVPLENLLLIKGEYWGNGCERGFELLEGREEIEKLANGDACTYGDLCFADYAEKGAARGLTDQQIAELLYIGHMGRAMSSPLYSPLQNRLVYYTHDDGWYTRVYCRNTGEVLETLAGQLTAGAAPPFPPDVLAQLMALAGGGILIDRTSGATAWSVRTVGEFSDMDELLRRWESASFPPAPVNELAFQDGSWSIRRRQS